MTYWHACVHVSVHTHIWAPLVAIAAAASWEMGGMVGGCLLNSRFTPGSLRVAKELGLQELEGGGGASGPAREGCWRPWGSLTRVRVRGTA